MTRLKLTPSNKFKQNGKIIVILFSTVMFLSCGNTKITPQSFFEDLQNSYKFSEDYKKYKVKYKVTRLNPYQSFDYQHPKDSVNGYKMYNSQIDLDQKQFYSHDMTYSPGGFIFDFVHFQKDSVLISYDVNGVLIGKQIEVGENTYENKKEGVTSFIDFISVANLMAKQNSDAVFEITIHEEKNKAQIKHIDVDSIINHYTFSLNPLHLTSIKNGAKGTKTVFSNYLTQNGVSYASNIDVYKEELLIRHYEIHELNKITEVDPSKLVVPKGYILPSKEKISDRGEIQKIAENLYLITVLDGGRNILFKVINNSIMVFGAPISDKISENVISIIKNKFPTKNIDYIYVTHSHSDHIGGLAAYTKRNAVILADVYTTEAIKAYPKFENDIQNFNFTTITNNQLLNNVRFYVPKNSHSLGQSFAYFEDAQIIYEGDFLELPADNTIPNYISKTEQEFVEFVRNEKLKIKRIVGNHRNANISVTMMNQYYDEKTKLE